MVGRTFNLSRLVRVAAALTVLALLSAPAFADAVAPTACDTSTDPDEKIAACTASILSGRYSGNRLAIAYNNRGFAYSTKGDDDRAIQDYSDAISQWKDFDWAYINRGVSYSRKGDQVRAIRDFNEAIRLKSRDLDEVYFLRGIAHCRKGDYDRGIKDFNEAIRLTPNNADAYSNRGAAYIYKGDYDRGIIDFNEAIRLKPDYADAYNNRGVAYAYKGDYDRAIEDFSRAISNPKYSTPAEAYANRGYAWFKKGTLPDLERAIADIGQALKIDPKLDTAKSDLADARAARDALIAQAKAQKTGRRIALVIGNSTYANAGPLPNAINDAREVAGALKALGYEIFGYDKTNFTKAALEREIAEFRKAAVGSTAAIIWYSGHGQMMVEKDNPNIRDWIIPVDASIKTDADVAGNAISLDALTISVRAAKKLRLVVVDACRDNSFFTGTRGVERFLDPTKLDGVVVVYSTSPGDVARDGPSGGNSPFAKAFIDSVKAKPGSDVRLLFSAVSGLTKTRTGTPPQRPIVESGLETDETVALKE